MRKPVPSGVTTSLESKSNSSYRSTTSIVFVPLSTLRSTTFGIWSHCSGVGFRRTAPPVAIRTPWWIISMPAVFSSKNMPLYWLLNTRTFRPRVSRYSRSFSFNGPSWARAAAEKQGHDRESQRRSGDHPGACRVVEVFAHGVRILAHGPVADPSTPHAV